jgi:hypothetical protein
MRRATLEGRQIGRSKLEIHRDALLRDRERGMSLSEIATADKISKASVCRVLKVAKDPVAKGSMPWVANSVENKRASASAVAA